MTTKRWLAFATTYEPNQKSSKWGAACIFFEFTDRVADADDFAIDPSVAYHPDAIAKAESGEGRLSPLFSDDQGYRSVSELINAE